MIVNLEAKKEIEVGDIVEYEGKYCMIIECSAIKELDYPIVLIDIKTGKYVNAYSDIHFVKVALEHRLVAKANEVVLTRR